MTETSYPLISIVIPVLHEGSGINEHVEHVFGLPYPGPREILIVDGSKHGDTIGRVQDRRCILLKSKPGRARQMNTGARAAQGRILLFLHADTALPQNGLTRAAEVLIQKKEQPCAAGAFTLRMETESRMLRLFIRLANVRNRILRTPYGDQAVFIHRDVFEEMGGYADIPLMEDVDLMRRLRKKSKRICILKEHVQTSARRYEAEGILFCSLRNLLLRTLFALGVPVSALAGFYKHSKE